MREIKFRAWDKVNGMFRKQEMIGEPTISKSDLSKGHIVFVNDIFKDKEFVWMQYTGLKDKNGVEIYEGDILKVFEYGRFGGEYLAPVSFVEYENNGESWSFFGFACLDVVEISHHIEVDSLFTRGFLMRKFGSCVQLSELTKDTKNSLEVIGNIYENPELLEVHNG